MDEIILDEGIGPKDDSIREPKYAGFWIRVGASLLDALVLLPFGALSIYNLISFKNLTIQILLTVISAIYKPYMEYTYGAALGKMWTNLKVISEEDLEGLTVNQTILRSSPWLFASFVNIFVLIMLFSMPEFEDVDGFMNYSLFLQQSDYNWLSQLASWPTIIAAIVVAFTAKKQGLHDMLAKTYCIYK